MKSTSNITSSVHCIKQAYEHFQSFALDNPESKGAFLFRGYMKKLEWVVKDLISQPAFPNEVSIGIRKEWESDTWAVPAIAEKVVLLNPQQREMIESIVDAMLSGEPIEIIENCKKD